MSHRIDSTWRYWVAIGLTLAVSGCSTTHREPVKLSQSPQRQARGWKPHEVAKSRGSHPEYNATRPDDRGRVVAVRNSDGSTSPAGDPSRDPRQDRLQLASEDIIDTEEFDNAIVAGKPGTISIKTFKVRGKDGLERIGVDFDHSGDIGRSGEIGPNRSQTVQQTSGTRRPSE